MDKQRDTTRQDTGKAASEESRKNLITTIVIQHEKKFFSVESCRNYPVPQNLLQEIQGTVHMGCKNGPCYTVDEKTNFCTSYILHAQ